MIRVEVPPQLRALAQVDGEVRIDLEREATNVRCSTQAAKRTARCQFIHQRKAISRNY